MSASGPPRDTRSPLDRWLEDHVRSLTTAAGIGRLWRGLSRKKKLLGIGSAVVLVALIIGLAAGGKKTHHTTYPPTTNAAATPPATTTPIGFEHLPLPGLYASDVYLNLRRRGFHCDGPHIVTAMAWYCRQSVPGVADYTVSIYGTSPGEITLIATAATVYADDVNGFARPVLGFVATMPYKGSQPQRARDWVESHVGTRQRILRIGHVRFRVYGGARGRFLAMGGI